MSKPFTGLAAPVVKLAVALVVGLGFALGCTGASALLFTGNLYYTYFTGGQNVWRVGYTYDDAT